MSLVPDMCSSAAPSATVCSWPSSSQNLKGKPLIPQVADANKATAMSALLEKLRNRCSYRC